MQTEAEFNDRGQKVLNAFKSSVYLLPGPQDNNVPLWLKNNSISNAYYKIIVPYMDSLKIMIFSDNIKKFIQGGREGDEALSNLVALLNMIGRGISVIFSQLDLELVKLADETKGNEYVIQLYVQQIADYKKNIRVLWKDVREDIIKQIIRKEQEREIAEREGKLNVIPLEVKARQKQIEGEIKTINNLKLAA